MSGTNVVDARGLSCPEPVLLAQNALKTYGDAAFTVSVDAAVARENVSKMLQGKGRTITVQEADDGWNIEVAAK
ncbi:MAG: sulfurtransferase TusA family protein [Oscillospiraceae bacterium]